MKMSFWFFFALVTGAIGISLGSDSEVFADLVIGFLVAGLWCMACISVFLLFWKKHWRWGIASILIALTLVSTRQWFIAEPLPWAIRSFLNFLGAGPFIAAAIASLKLSDEWESGTGVTVAPRAEPHSRRVTSR